MKKLFTLLIALFSFLSMSLGQSVTSITLPGANFCISAPSTSFPVKFDYLNGVLGSNTVKIRIMNPTNTAVLYSEDFTFTSTTASSETFTANISLPENPLVVNPIAGNNRVVTIANSSGSTVISVVSAPIDLRRLPVITNVGPPLTACESASLVPITLSGVILGGGATQGKWSVLPGGTVAGAGPNNGLSSLALTGTPQSVTFTPATNDFGTVTLRLTTNNPLPCGVVTADRVITVNPLPTLTGVTATPACAGSNVTVTALGLLNNTSGDLTYTLNGVLPGITIPYTTTTGSFSFPISGAVGGEVIVIKELSISSSSPTCSQTFSTGNSVTLVVNPKPLSVFVTPITTSACAGTPVTISSSISVSNAAPFAHSWSVTGPAGAISLGTPSSSSTSSASFNGTGQGMVEVKYNVTDNNGCVAAELVAMVSIKDPPVAMLPMTPITQCNNLTFSLAAPSLASQPLLATGLWTVVSGGSVTFSDASSPTSTATITSSPTVLRWTVNNLPCSPQSTNVTLTNQTPVLGSSLTPPAICSGSTFSYNASSLPTGATFSWTRAAIGGNLASMGSSGIINDVLINNTLANVTVTYVFSLSLPGCSAGPTQNVQVVVKPKPSVTPLTPFNVVTCTGGGFSITPLTNVVNGADGSIPTGTTYSWPAPTVVPGAITGGAAGLSSSNLTSISASSLVNNTALPQTATYNVTPSFNGCSGTSFTVTVTVNPKPIITSVFTRTTCSGVAFTPVMPANGVPDVVPTGTTYTWTTPTYSASGLSGGVANTLSGVTSITGTLVNNTTFDLTATYTVTPKAGLCDGGTFEVVVTVKPAAALTSGSTTSPSAICSGDEAKYTPAGGSAYSWTRVATASDGSSASTGAINEILHNTTEDPFTATYLYTVTTTNGCVTTSIPVTVVVNPRPVITAMTKTTCSDAPFTVTPVHGPSPNNGIVPTITTYTWAAPTYSATGLTGGVANTLSGITSITGTLSNPTSAPITATYVVTPTAGTCVGLPFNIVVTVNPNPAITNMAATYCSGVPFTVTPQNIVDGTVPVGTTYKWGIPTLVGGLSGLSASGTTTESNITGTLTNTSRGIRIATYQVTPSFGVTPSFVGCPSPSTFDVVVTINPKPAITNMTATTCSGVAFSINPTNGTNGLVPNAVTSYSWSAPSVSNALLTGGAAGTATATNASFFTIGTLTNGTTTDQTATYVVTPTASASLGGCVGATFEVFVTVKPTPVISGTLVVCKSGGTTQLSATPTPSTVYWLATNGTGAATVSSSGLVTGGSTAGSVTITYTAANGCSSSATVTVNARPVIADEPAIVVCAGSPFAVVPSTATPNIIPPLTTYSWSAPSVTSGITGGAGGIGASFINGTLGSTLLTQGQAIYMVTPSSSAIGCEGAPFSVTVNVNPKPAITPIVTTICSGVGFTVTPASPSNGVVPTTPGTTYTWTAPTYSATGLSGGVANTLSGVTSITGTLTNNTTGPIDAEYTVIPKSGSCVGASFKVTVTVKPSPTINAPALFTICSGESVTVVPTGVFPVGTTYTWPSGTGLTFGPLTNPGITPTTFTYSVSPTFASCTGASFDVQIKVNPTPTVAGDFQICKGSMTQLTGSTAGSGTVTPSWLSSATGIATVSSTGKLMGISAGTCTITYTDNNGCIKTVSVIIDPSPTVTIATTANFISQDCTLPGVTATVIGGTSPYSPTGWSSSDIAKISFSNTNTLTTSVIASLSPVVSTTANVTINYEANDANGCVTEATPLVLTVYPKLTASVSGATSLCIGATNQFSSGVAGGNSAGVSNGTPPASRTFDWASDSPNATVSATGLVKGITAGSALISVTVTDASGCSATSSQVVTIKAAPVLTPLVNPVSCLGSGNGAINLQGQITSPATTYTYQWSNNALLNNNFNPDLSPGFYDVTITDNSITTCPQIITGIEITGPSANLTASITGATAVCQGSTAPLVTFTGLGGTAQYKFKYTINDGATITTITTPLSTSGSVTVSVPTSASGTFVYALVNVTSAACNASASGSATVTVDASLPSPLTPAVNAGVDQLGLVLNTTTLTHSAIPSSLPGLTGTWSVVPANASVTFVPTVPATSTTTKVLNLPPGSSKLRWTIANGACKAFDDVDVNVLLPKADIYVILEGALGASAPLMDANIRGTQPLTVISPAALAYFTLTQPSPLPPVAVSSSVLLINGATAIVDKITIELRSTATGPAVATRQGLVRSDGKVVEADGLTSLSFNVSTGSYFVVVKHRNHLTFRSASAQALTSGATAPINFAVGLPAAQAIQGGIKPGLKLIGGVRCAYAGDFNGDGAIDTFDFIQWLGQNGTNGFLQGDFNLDGAVNVIDFVKWSANNGTNAN
jgi:PKD-like domain/Bacterial Ig-like domain (group 2)